MVDTYKTIANTSESLHKVKGSKHFGYAIPVTSEEQVNEELEKIKKQHHSARHHCYAWRLGREMDRYRANDDGEPSNSAGPPILGQIQSFGLTNILVVVVRYFGGTKLGVGGLISAYKTAAQEAIEANHIIEKKVYRNFSIHFGYEDMSDVMQIIRIEGFEDTDQDFRENCSLKIALPLSESERIQSAFQALPNVKIKDLGIY